MEVANQAYAHSDAPPSVVTRGLVDVPMVTNVLVKGKLNSNSIIRD